MPTEKMYPVRELRRKNLAAVVQQFGTQAGLAKKLDVDSSFISQLLNGHRHMGDDVARKIERAAGKRTGWMDNPQPDAWGQLLMARAAGRPVFTNGDKDARRAWIESVLGDLDDADIDVIVPIIQRLRRAKGAPEPIEDHSND